MADISANANPSGNSAGYTNALPDNLVPVDMPALPDNLVPAAAPAALPGATPAPTAEVLPPAAPAVDPMGADTSPVPVPDRTIDDQYNLGGTQAAYGLDSYKSSLDLPPEYIQAAGKGVLIDKPLQKGSVAASFAYGPDQVLAAYKNANPDIKTRVGPDSKEPEYYDPNNNRWAIIEPMGTKPLGNAAGTMTAVAPELVMGFLPMLKGVRGLEAVATASGTLKGQVGLQAGSAFLGEIMRLGAGKYIYDVNGDVTHEQIIDKAISAAELSGASALVMGGLTKFGGVVLDAMKGRAITKEMAATAGLGIEEVQEIQRRINEVIGPERFRIDSAKASGDVEWMAWRRALARDPEFIKQFSQMDRDQQDSLLAFFTKIHEPYDSALNASQTTKMIGGFAQGTIDTAKEQFQRQIDRGKAIMRRYIGELPARRYEEAGGAIRGIASEDKDAFDTWAKDVAVTLHGTAGGKPFIENNHLADLLNSKERTISDGLFPKLEASTGSLIGPRVQGEAPVDPGVRALRAALGADNPETEEVINKVFNKGELLTFKQSWDALSGLNRMVRDASHGVGDAPDIGFLRQMASAIQKDIGGSMQGAQVPASFGLMWDAYRTTYAQEADRLLKGTVGKILSRDGANGPYKVADDSVFESAIFAPGTNGGEQARHIMALRGHDTEMINAIREGITDFIKRRVYQDGRIDQEAYRSLMVQYAPAFREYMGMGTSDGYKFADSEVLKAYLQPGRMEKGLRLLESQKEDAVTKLNQTFEGTLANLNHPDKILNTIFNSAEPTNIMRAKELLEPFPEVWRGVQSAYRERFYQGVIDRKPNSIEINPTRLSNWLHGKADAEVGGVAKSQQPVIEALYGKEHWDNLNVLEDALNIAARKGPSVTPNDENNSLLKTLARIVVGPLSTGSRVITAYGRLQSAAARRTIVDAITNPETMVEMARLRDFPMNAPEVGAFLGSVGATILRQNHATIKASDIPADQLEPDTFNFD